MLVDILYNFTLILKEPVTTIPPSETVVTVTSHILGLNSVTLYLP